MPSRVQKKLVFNPQGYQQRQQGADTLNIVLVYQALSEK